MYLLPNRFVCVRIGLLLLPALLLLAAPSPHAGYMTDYVNACDALTKTLAAVTDEKSAQASQPAVAADITRLNAAKAQLQKTPLDQNNPDHKAAFQQKASDLSAASVRLAQEMKRITNTPKIEKVLHATLANLK